MWRDLLCQIDDTSYLLFAVLGISPVMAILVVAINLVIILIWVKW